MGLIVVGIVLILLSIGGFWYMQRLKLELHAMIGTDTLSLPELADLRKIAHDLGASFTKVAEVVGAAHPNPSGPLIAELSKTECVWYRYQIERQYEHVYYRDGRRHRTKRTEKVTDYTSQQGYALIDPQGRTIGVDPGGTEPGGIEQTVSTFEPYRGGNEGMRMFSIRLPDIFGNRDSTIGFEYKEWVIRPGRAMYILGEVHDRIGPLVIGKPEDGGHFIISTRTEAELRAARAKSHKLTAIAVIAAFVLGLGLTVAGSVVQLS